MATCRRVLATAVLLLALSQLCWALTLQVEPKTSECFSEELEKGKEVKINYQVLRGGLLDIKFQVLYEGEATGARFKDVLYEQMYFENEGEPGLYTLKTRRPGIYTFCFDNTIARFTAKVVSFRVMKHNRWNMPEPEDQDSVDLLEPMDRSAKRISEELEMLEMHQQYMRARELRHSVTQQSTNRRVFWFSVLEAMALLGISIFQVYYIKRFFHGPKNLL
eukprot:CAMPEP_0114612638 /NCGR_PEP_ID=MMETSP0168-20121206/4723_1 /TAXON_ID=95228 ORGANISM="Vannella sp., Strain DIVA3 517/6/12" /NCGR_SAMPLE_ID=MMETSP0168 /ASSEMBLY_ACC=CAM_ASM_000044 /LENGTH=219 /DNA_ID=CAMNT_0001823625 /DNA_START=27 /DNA_END=686 /DNA_ORIENTATION=-